jgi:DNA-binding CsgD family transcriptional regulator
VYIHPNVVVIEGRHYRLVPIEPVVPTQPLTQREHEIVAQVRLGRVNKQIAAELGISEHTVSTHLRRIFRKLGVDTRAAMVHVYAGVDAP